jgi:hypothetical protein
MEVLKNRSFLASAVVGVLLAAVVYCSSNPLRRSDEALQQWLLKKVPMGSDMKDLKVIAAQQGWQLSSIWEGNEHPDWVGIEGNTVVRVYLGGYRTVFRTEVGSFWAFDRSGRLIGVRIDKSVDAP